MPRGQVRDADGRIRLVDVLAAGARGAVGVDAQLGGIEIGGFDFVGLRQDGHGDGRRVNAPLRLGGRHALHAMHAGFELEARERAVAGDAADDFAVAAMFAGLSDSTSTLKPCVSA